MIQFNTDKGDLFVSYKLEQETVVFENINDATIKMEELKILSPDKLYYIESY
jgi:hypothetical protein